MFNKKEKLEVTSDDFNEDKYSRLRLINWWDQEKLTNALVMVVGAGAIGNELIKNLALLGIGKIIVVDMDTIENSNLTRAVLFRKNDVGRLKAEVAAEKAEEMNPDIKAISMVKNIIDEVGLGVFRRMQVVLGGLDNREARLGINQSCYKVNVPWIDGAIEVLNGFARVFVPNEGACYECTMTETDWNLINKRRSCSLLSNEEMNSGKIPTTPTSSSVIAGIQVQEMLKLLHKDRNLPNLTGKGFVFNGLTHDSFVVEYQEKKDCLSHETFDEIVEKAWTARESKIIDVLNEIRSEIGSDTIIEFDRNIATYAKCSCGKIKKLFVSVRKLKGQDLFCEDCKQNMAFDYIHTISGEEDFLEMTFFEIGIPLLHIITARNSKHLKHYEFSNDLNEVFSHFE
ncbi:MAG: ThiF family adenylyltransferase [Bacillota bacterium]